MWYRVNDPLNPLCGCDVRTGDVGHLQGGSRKFYEVTAVRRVDVFVGDRPYQLVASEGDSLGILIANDHLVDSPIQDDVVEIATSSPFGKCIEERDHDRDDGVKLHAVQYELMGQAVLIDSHTGILGSWTVPLGSLEEIEETFCEGADVDEVMDLATSEAI